MENIEIERKFLIKDLPEGLEQYEHKAIEQGYLSKEPVVRVRKSGDSYYMTYKGKGLLEREEYNLPLTKESYEHLVAKADGNIIKKTRYKIPYKTESGEALVIELDIFDFPKDLVMAEVEFKTRQQAENFKAPEWFANEVTQNPKYHNVNMI